MIHNNIFIYVHKAIPVLETRGREHIPFRDDDDADVDHGDDEEDANAEARRQALAGDVNEHVLESLS